MWRLLFALPCFFRHDRDLQPFRMSNDRQCRAEADLDIGEEAVQIVDSGDGLVFARDSECDDEAPFADSRGPGRAVGLDAENDDSGFFRQIVEAHNSAMDWNRLRRNTDVAAPDASIMEQARGDKFCRVDADREADALSELNGRGVDANDVALRVDERTS